MSCKCLRRSLALHVLHVVVWCQCVYYLAYRSTQENTFQYISQEIYSILCIEVDKYYHLIYREGI